MSPVPSTEPETPRPIFVVGASRSGTSVVTRMINLLGAPLCVDEDLHSGADNPEGHWESRSVIAVNEELLAGLQGAWALPPAPDGAWWREPELDRLRDQARRTFTASHPLPGWVCKDPRLSLTLPFWLEALQLERAILVLVLRQPGLVARSLVDGGVPAAHALAMWERYSLSALRHLQGHRVAVVRYDAVLQDPVGTARSLGGILEAAGARASSTRAEEAAGAVLVSGREAESPSSASWEINVRQEALWVLMQKLPAWSEAFAVEVPEESSTTTELLRALTAVAWWEGQVGMIHDHLGALLGRERPMSP